MADENLAQAVAGLRQQVTALASVAGVLLAALRRAGLMDPAYEALLSSEIVNAATAQSAQVRPDWDVVLSAVQKIAAATATTTSGSPQKSDP